MRKHAALVLSLLLAPALASAGPTPPPRPGAPAANPPAAPAPDNAADDEAGGDEGDEEPADFGAVLQAAGMKPQLGPQKISLGKSLVLELPEEYLFLDANDAKKFAEMTKNLPDEHVLGVVLRRQGVKWWVEITFDEEGYIKDDEADKLDAEAILQSYKDGTESANKERGEKGFKPLHVGGWAEAPRYEKTVHHVVWGLKVDGDDGSSSVNFNTRVLGRKGYASLNVIGPMDLLAEEKLDATRLLAATKFESGSRYEDFKEGSDKVADYGLAALIAGGAGVTALKLVKGGLLIKFFGPLLKGCAAGAKLIIPAFIAFFAGIKRLFSRKEKGAPPADTVAGSAPSSESFAAGGESAPTANTETPPTGSSSDGEPPPTT